MAVPGTAFIRLAGRLGLGAFLLLAALSPRPAVDQSLCSEPIEPACVELDTTYGEEDSTRRCRQDLLLYDEQVEEYLACIAQDRSEVVRVRRSLWQHFNCRAGREGACPQLPAEDAPIGE